jgi:hypothetical protein
MNTPDPINPTHYTTHPSGVQCIEISQHLSGCLAQAFQYVWRCGQKDDPEQELKKALWFIERELTIAKPQIIKELLFKEALVKVTRADTNLLRAVVLLRLAMANVQTRNRTLDLIEAKEAINLLIDQYKEKRHETPRFKTHAPQTTHQPIQHQSHASLPR